MPYRVVFRNGENAKNGEIIINAVRTKYDRESGIMQFFDNEEMPIAYIPIDRILYIKKAENNITQ